MRKLKLMTVVGTRPELIRLSETIKKADKYFEHVFVHTGQNYDANLNDVFYDDLDLRKPDYYLDVAGNALGETLGNIIARCYSVMKEIQPEALLILGDTNSALSAIPAKRLKVPVFHMEAGNRCFDENTPEEVNRRIVDHISDVNLPYTEHARRNLLAEGVSREYIFVTGSPMREVILANDRKIGDSAILDVLSLEGNGYIVVSAHRENNIDDPVAFDSLMKALNALAEEYGMPVVYSVHPRSAKFIKERSFTFHDSIREMPPFSFSDYSRLMRDAFCVVSDSGTLMEEAAIGKFPAVSIRTSTERPEALEGGVFILGGIDEKNVLRSVRLAVEMRKNKDEGSAVMEYAAHNVSGKVLRIIQGYTDIVNRNIWRK